MNIQALEELGLSTNEAKLYLALLELKESSVTPLVRKAEIPSSKLYEVAEKLIQKGLMSTIEKNNIKYFQASSPENLLAIIKDKESSLKSQENDIYQLIKSLKSPEPSEVQKVRTFEGIEGLKAAFREILETLSPREEYLAFTADKDFEDEEAKIFFGNFHAKRTEKKIGARLIAPKEQKEVFSKYYKYPLMKLKLSNKPLPKGIFIFKNKVMTLTFAGKPFVCIIESENNTHNYRKFFENTWKSL